MESVKQVFFEEGADHTLPETKKDIIAPAPVQSTSSEENALLMTTLMMKKQDVTNAVDGAQVPPTYEAAGDSVAAASAYVLENLVFRTDVPDSVTAKRLANETVSLWNSSINPGFLQYRKSVAEAEDFAALEWMDDPKRPGGCTLVDHRGNEYIDLLGGFGIYSCGHSHPKIISAVQSQLTKQPLHSQELLDPLRAYCANILKKTLPGELGKDGFVFFTNSGTESVEACLKFAMLRTNRKNFIGVVGAFHGKTMGSLSGTSKAVFRKPFAGMGALLPFQHVKMNDCNALRAAFEASKFNGNEIAAFIVEPVIGEGGIHVCSNEFLQEARKLCTEYGALMICDEVQSGMGRTGKFWACEHAGVVPDLMAVAKGFGGGVMGAGACIGTRDVMEPLFENPFIHTTTFGGNPLACTAAIAAMHVTVTENLPANAQAKGDWLLAKLNDLKARYPHIIKEARGRGLMIGLEFHSDEIGYSFSKAVMSRGILLSGTLIAARVLRVEPPLTITQEEVEIVAERFEASLLAMTQSGIASAPENVPASLKAAGLYNSNPGGAFAIKCAEGYTLSAAAHINPTANPLAAPAVLSIGHGGPGLSPREAHISSPKNGGPHHAFPSAHVGVHVHHHHHHHQAAAAAAAAPVPVVAAPTAAVSAPAPTAAVPAAVAVAAPAPVEEEEDDEVGNVEHQLARQRRNKSSKNKHHGTSSAARSAPNSGSKDSKDEAKLAALRELEGGGSVGETSAAMAAPAASPRHGHHHHRRHHRPHPATGAASAASAAAGPLFLDGEAGDGKDEEKRRTSSMTSNDSAAHPGPILMGHEGGAAGVAAPGGGGAASGAGRHSAAATSSRSAHEADDEAEDDDEEEDDEDDEDESDVSSVSSTSTESVSGMSSEDDE